MKGRIIIIACLLAMIMAVSDIAQAQSTVNKTATATWTASTTGDCSTGCSVNVYASLTNNVSSCPATPTYSRVNAALLANTVTSFSWSVAVSAPYCLQVVATSVDTAGYESSYSTAAVFLQQAPQAPLIKTLTVQ